MIGVCSFRAHPPTRTLCCTFENDNTRTQPHAHVTPSATPSSHQDGLVPVQYYVMNTASMYTCPPHPSLIPPPLSRFCFDHVHCTSSSTREMPDMVTPNRAHPILAGGPQYIPVPAGYASGGYQQGGVAHGVYMHSGMSGYDHPGVHRDYGRAHTAASDHQIMQANGSSASGRSSKKRNKAKVCACCTKTEYVSMSLVFAPPFRVFHPSTYPTNCLVVPVVKMR